MSGPVSTPVTRDTLPDLLKAGSPIAGVRARTLEMHRDPRGSFTEVFSNLWNSGLDPAQWNIVKSEPGVLRGMHLHRRHDEYILVAGGRASVGLRDIRPGSPTNGAWSLYELSGDALTCLTFPRGIVHGWLFHEPTLHLQAVSEVYPDYQGDDNLGCHWSDPELEIPWPATPSVVAPRAEAFPPLRELIAQTLRLDPDFHF